MNPTARLKKNEMELTAKGIPRALQFAFQEYDIEKLDPHEHAFTVIERTLAFGNREELRWLFSRYGAQQLTAWVQEWGWRLLPRRRLVFWSIFFVLDNLPRRQGVWPH
jgi:hypothetical protein